MGTEVPWRSERPLDPAGVERVADAQFPSLAPCRARYLAEGWDSEAYLVNDAWVLRFPKRREVEAHQDVERVLLPRLAPTLPLPVPAPTLLGEASGEFPFRFLGYRRLDGEPAYAFPPERVDLGRCADLLGSFLSRLHAFPAGEARALGVPERTWNAEEVPSWFDRRRSEVAPLLPEDLARRAERFFAGSPPAASSLPPTLVHADLRCEHLLLGPDGRLAGVIDWGDAALADPALDFAGVVAWRGLGFAEAVLRRYRGEVDDGFLARVRWRAAWSALMTAWAAACRAPASDLVRSRAELENALAG